jgi:hypothetical protein
MKGFLVFVAALVWGLVAALLIAPYGDGFIAYARYCIPIAVCGLCWAWYSLAEENRVIGQSLPNILIGGGSMVAFFLMTTVNFRNAIAGSAVEGTVIGTERSPNHQYPVVIIADGGETVRLEGVAEEFFQIVHKEDRVEKRAGAVVGLLNGKVTPILESSILDLIRLGTRQTALGKPR